MRRKGFTLIELLVVIAIIGLLSTLAVVSLNDARAKARDAKRISDVKQMATILEMEASDNAQTLGPAACIAGALTTLCTTPGQVSQFPKFVDPSVGAACVCDTTTRLTAPCGYSISNGLGTGVATTGDYQICFVLEKGAGNLIAGEGCITTGSQIKSEPVGATNTCI